MIDLDDLDAPQPDNVVDLDIPTRLDIPVAKVLRSAKQENLQHIVILGYDEDGHEFFSSSYADGAEVVWLLERCKFKLMQQLD